MRKLEGPLSGLAGRPGGVAGVIFALTAVLISVNVVLRAGFTSAIFGLYDAIEFGLLAATFLAAPWVLARKRPCHGGHRADGLSARQRRRIGRLTNLLGAVLCAVFVYYSLTATLASAARGSMIRTSFVIPEWWVLSVMPLAMALMMIEFVLRFRRGITAERGRVEL
jgi:TRAP-type transport system small permease protein